MRPEKNFRGVFFEGGLKLFCSKSLRQGLGGYFFLNHMRLLLTMMIDFVENQAFYQKIKNKSTKKAKKNIKNLSVQLQLLTFATPT